MATADLVSSISWAVRCNEGKEGEKEEKSGEQFHKWMLETLFMRQGNTYPTRGKDVEREDNGIGREEMVGARIRLDLKRV